MTKICLILFTLILCLALAPSLHAQSADATAISGQGQTQGQLQGQLQGQGQGQTANANANAQQGQTQGQGQGQSQSSAAVQGQGMSNQINSGQVNITSEPSRNYALPYQLYPPGLAVDFGNGNTYGNFVKIPGAFVVKRRFSRSELEIMRKTWGTCVKFRNWAGPKQGAKKPTDYVDFMWELPLKPSVGPDGKPVFNDKGQPVMVGYAPDTWTELGSGTATVTNGDQDTYSLISEYGLQCLDTEKCNMVFFVGEGLKTFVRAWGANLSIGYTYASVSDQGGNSGVGGAGAGIAYGKTGRLADPWLQGHFIYDSAAQPQQ